MAKGPWLTIIGLGEDGPEGLSPASLATLEAAEIVMGPPRHLSLLPTGPWETIDWPVPYTDGIPRLLDLRGRRVAVLASGDPFWFGAGSVLTRNLEPDEWRAFPAPSTFSIVAARLGWPLENVKCLGLHAAPLSRLRPHLAPAARIIALLRDGMAVQDLAAYLVDAGFEGTQITVCEAVGGPRERVSRTSPTEVRGNTYVHPVCVALEVDGTGILMPRVSGLPDDLFENDGQLTKRPVRALTLSTLSPRSGEHLWDIGGGSGSIAIEWLLADPSMRATCIEINKERSDRIKDNALTLGVDRLKVVHGEAPRALAGLARPDAVFVGGGLSPDLLSHITMLDAGTRLVANAVTLEAETILAEAQSRFGGSLMRMDIAYSAPLGTKRGWRASYPIVQWSVTL